jgi:hypothetical protein
MVAAIRVPPRVTYRDDGDYPRRIMYKAIFRHMKYSLGCIRYIGGGSIQMREP